MPEPATGTDARRGEIVTSRGHRGRSTKVADALLDDVVVDLPRAR